jgi:hypothetical protein
MGCVRSNVRILKMHVLNCGLRVARAQIQILNSYVLYQVAIHPEVYTRKAW